MSKLIKNLYLVAMLVGSGFVEIQAHSWVVVAAMFFAFFAVMYVTELLSDIASTLESIHDDIDEDVYRDCDCEGCIDDPEPTDIPSV